MADITQKTGDALDGNSPYQEVVKKKFYEGKPLNFNTWRKQQPKSTYANIPGSGQHNVVAGRDYQVYKIRVSGPYVGSVKEVKVSQAQMWEIYDALEQVRTTINSNLGTQQEGNGYNNHDNIIPDTIYSKGDSIRFRNLNGGITRNALPEGYIYTDDSKVVIEK